MTDTINQFNALRILMITAFITTIIPKVTQERFEKGIFGEAISKLISTPPFGRLVFQLTIFIKQLSLQMAWSPSAVENMGGWFDRAVEYPWVLRQITRVQPGSLVLDIGCSESLLSHELSARRFKVVALDIRDYPFKSKEVLFVKRNITDTRLPNEKFDAIIMVSTIEHVGLSAYGQLEVEDEGDINAMKELNRILSLKGIIILTTPYVGGKTFEIWQNFERLYNKERLSKLIEDFNILTEEYFYPKRIGKRLVWNQMDHKEIDKQHFFELAGLACLVLKKKQKIECKHLIPQPT